jgi:CRP-like cAMP-binding protein
MLVEVNVVAAETLKKAGLFQGLNDSELTKLAGLAQSNTFNNGEALINESDLGKTMYLIVEGRVDVMVSIPGSENTEPLATLKEGDVVGELILLGRERRSAHAIARDNVKVVHWKKDDLIRLFDTDHIIGYKIMRQLASLLADRLISTNLVLRNVLTVPRTIFM